MPFPCHNCLLASPDNKRCQKCKAVFYCGKECQKQDWNNRTHKLDCKKSSSHHPPPPKYQEEYSRAYPEDRRGAMYLNEGYLESTIHEGEIRRRGGFRVACRIGEDDMFFRRWDGFKSMGEMERRRLVSQHGQGKMRPGTVFQSQMSFHGETLNFHNHTPTQLHYHVGETYVAIGFVDLLQLLIGEFHDDKTDSPLTFLGIESGETQIAKSRIILEMFLDEKTSCKSVLQVWFSTVLDKEAHEALVRACKKLLLLLLSKNDDIGERPRDVVKEFLAKSISPESAMEQWGQSVKVAIDILPLNFLSSQKDRIQFARYQNTGVLFCDDNSNYHAGNPTIVFPRNDNFFYTVGSHCLRHYERSLMETVETYFGRKAEVLKDLLVRRRIDCKFRHEMVLMDDDDDASLAKEIRSLRPSVIEWSNVPDYFDSKIFLRFAESCSVEDTLHTLHSMNWTRQLYGASIVDYAFLEGYDVDSMYESAKNFLELDRRVAFRRDPHMSRIFNSDGIRFLSMDLIDAVLGWYFKRSYLDHVYGGGEGRRGLGLLYADRSTHCNDEILRRDNAAIDFVLAGACWKGGVAAHVDLGSAKELLKKYVVNLDG